MNVIERLELVDNDSAVQCFNQYRIRTPPPRDGMRNGTTTSSYSGPKSNGNKGLLPIPQTPRQESHNLLKFHVILRIPYSSIDTITVWKKSCFTIQVRRTNHTLYCRRSKAELRNKLFLSTLTHILSIIN